MLLGQLGALLPVLTGLLLILIAQLNNKIILVREYCFKQPVNQS